MMLVKMSHYDENGEKITRHYYAREAKDVIETSGLVRPSRTSYVELEGDAANDGRMLAAQKHVEQMLVDATSYDTCLQDAWKYRESLRLSTGYHKPLASGVMRLLWNIGIRLDADHFVHMPKNAESRDMVA